MLLGTRVQFPPPPFDSLRSLMAGRLALKSSESNALSKRSASKGTQFVARHERAQRVEWRSACYKPFNYSALREGRG
jgi:hypothetical protein